jgi:Na+/H+-dicarboxylate symporter/ABC-type amino acid transport substrate-binding protein
VKPRISLSGQIFTGILAGVAVGLFFGERTTVLQPVADVYVKLLQMTVLPYVVLSLVGGFGLLNAQEAGRLAVRVGCVLLALWAVSLLAVFALPLMFPRIDSASFFSTTLLDESASFDLIGLYVPSNPFYALANNIVPAVVLFSALLGIALIGVPGKASALGVIEILSAAVSRLAKFIVALTPYGLFAIAAVTAGTFDLGEAIQLEIYLACYLTISLLLSLWILPGLVAILTPVPYRALLSRTRDALVMAFATGSLLVVLPLLAEQTRELLKEHAGLAPHDERLPDVIIPTAYNFPNAGKLLAIGFVLFAAWFTGASIPPRYYPELAATGVLTLFGSVNVAVPFMLDMFRVPADTFQLFLATSVVGARFGTLLAAMHTLAIATVGTCAVAGLLRIDVRRLVRFGITTLVLAAILIAGTRALVGRATSRPYDKDRVLAGMHALRDRGNARVFRTTAPPLPPLQGSVLDRVRARKTLRVAYFEDSLPYAFVNGAGDLVGFDVEMAQQLARELNVGLELVPVSRRIFDEGLDPPACDLVMSGAAVTAERSLHVRFSASYLDETLALVVADHRRAEFATWDDVRAAQPLRLGVPALPYFLKEIQKELPTAVIVPLASPEEMFERRDAPLDALVLTAERGSAYTLLHPAYSVVVPRPRQFKVPLAYVIAGHDDALAAVVDTWIDLKRKDGTIDELFAHWILGRNATPKEPRWSVLDDVLHWGRR